jgi:O-methyltransferase
MYKYAEQMQSNLRYANAEVGCFQGEFAKEINAAFPNNKLYLFDTFQGFVEPDISSDTVEKSVMEVLSSEFVQTSVQTVIDKMIYPENIIIKQGYFPDTFDIGEERFGFVSVDADLYAPTKSALEIFFPLMADRGLLLVHDYYNNLLPGVRKAVDEFVSHSSTRFLPIGDAMSVAIFK